MNHTSLYDMMSHLMMDPEFQYERPTMPETKKKKSLHDCEHNGSIVEYMDEDMNKTYHAVFFDDRYIPIAKDAAELKSEDQIVAVYDYPLNDLNEAFWNQGIDLAKAKLVWSRSFVNTEKKINEIDMKIKKLKEERKHYASKLPKGYKIRETVKGV